MTLLHFALYLIILFCFEVVIHIFPSIFPTVLFPLISCVFFREALRLYLYLKPSVISLEYKSPLVLTKFKFYVLPSKYYLKTVVTKWLS